jgi:hypothetical protein
VAATKKTAPAKVEAPSFTVQSKIKEYLAGKGLRSSGDLIDEVNVTVQQVLDKAAARTRSNDRSTVRGGDI